MMVGEAHDRLCWIIVRSNCGGLGGEALIDQAGIGAAGASALAVSPGYVVRNVPTLWLLTSSISSADGEQSCCAESPSVQVSQTMEPRLRLCYPARGAMAGAQSGLNHACSWSLSKGLAQAQIGLI